VFDFASPAARPPSRSLSVSAIFHCAVAILLLTLHFAPAIRAMPIQGHVTVLAPTPAIRQAPAPKPPIAKIEPVAMVEASPAPAAAPPPVAREFHAPVAAPRPVPSKVTLAAIPPVLETPHLDLPRFELPPIEHAAPRVLKTDNFSDTKIDAPVSVAKVAAQPAGFGAMEKLSTVAPARSSSTSTGSFGSASSGTAAVSEHRPISRSTFGDVQIAANAPMARKTETAATTAVEILFKPHPVYTAEARGLQIEGEVLLEIQFAASGELRIIRVVRGLGHGLDESATDAARHIRFRPALHASVPVDSTAIVHIQFQLAY
jgi:TonB family protein